MGTPIVGWLSLLLLVLSIPWANKADGSIHRGNIQQSAEQVLPFLGAAKRESDVIWARRRQNIHLRGPRCISIESVLLSSLEIQLARYKLPVNEALLRGVRTANFTSWRRTENELARGSDYAINRCADFLFGAASDSNA